MIDRFEASVESGVVLCCYLHLKRFPGRSKGCYLCFLHFIVDLTALRLVQHLLHSSAASEPSDITNMAVGQDRVLIILTFCFERAVRSPQYVHRTELDDSHWLHHAGHAGRGFVTWPAALAKRPSILHQAMPKLVCRTLWSARLTSSLARLASSVLQGAMLEWGVGEWVVRWAVPLASYFYYKTYRLSHFC